MPQFSQVATVLRVPIDNFSALTTGISVGTISRSFIREKQQFILVESSFTADAQESTIRYWASCESSQAIEDNYNAEYLSKITNLSENEVQKQLDQNANFLVFLRVYRIPVEMQQSLQFNRQFAALVTPIAVVDEFPIISNQPFEKKKYHIQNQIPLEHPELEALQSTIDLYARDHPEAQNFSNEFQQFLGWTEGEKVINPIPPWIPKITTFGNSSEGNPFEKLVRQAFLELGFTNLRNDANASLNPDANGGAGGIDFYCEFPYSIVGECKASTSVKLNDNKDGAPAQLIKLGQKHLTSEEYDRAIKMIIAPGELNKHAKKTAIGNKMNVMSPETLQRLVELKISHPGSINLLELKPCLEAAPFGTDADAKVTEFIDNIYQRLKLRSHIVSTFKSCIEKNKLKEIGIDRFCGFFAASDSPQHLSDRELYDILIELSSPLTGYLGRIKCDTWKSDRFYFLRELVV